LLPHSEDAGTLTHRRSVGRHSQLFKKTKSASPGCPLAFQCGWRGADAIASKKLAPSRLTPAPPPPRQDTQDVLRWIVRYLSGRPTHCKNRPVPVSGMPIQQKTSRKFASIASIDRIASKINDLRQRVAAQSLEMPGEKGSRRRVEEGGTERVRKRSSSDPLLPQS
jgi:hypothetical protein